MKKSKIGIRNDSWICFEYFAGANIIFSRLCFTFGSYFLRRAVSSAKGALGWYLRIKIEHKLFNFKIY